MAAGKLEYQQKRKEKNGKPLYTCVCAYRVLYAYRHLQLSEMDWIAKDSQPSKFLGCKTLSHPCQGWSLSQAMGSEGHSERVPTAGQGRIPTVVRDKRYGRMKSGSEFHALLIAKFKVIRLLYKFS